MLDNLEDINMKVMKFHKNSMIGSNEPALSIQGGDH